MSKSIRYNKNDSYLYRIIFACQDKNFTAPIFWGGKNFNARISGSLLHFLNERYGKAQPKYDKHNVIGDNQTVIIGYLEEIPIACGCFKSIDDNSIEIERMNATPVHRRKGFSTKILSALESWAKELGFFIVCLETGMGAKYISSHGDFYIAFFA